MKHLLTLNPAGAKAMLPQDARVPPGSGRTRAATACGRYGTPPGRAPESKWQISTDGGNRPRWARDDREIVFVAPDFGLMIVDVELAPQFRASVPRLLLDPGMRQINGTQYDFSRDGSRLLVNRPLEQPTVLPVTLVQNWTEALGR